MKRRKLHIEEFILAMIFLAVIIACFTFLSGCMTPKKAVNYLKKKQLLADTCAANFPVRDSTIFRSDTLFDTLYLDTPVMVPDTVLIQGKPITFYRECPPPLVITKTITRDSIIVRRDIAQETAFKEDADKNKTLYLETKDELYKWKGRAKERWWWLFALIAILTITTLWKYIKPLMKFL